MRPIINFTEIKRGAYNSPKGTINANSTTFKTLQSTVNCSRSENLDVYTSNMQSIVNQDYCRHLESNFADYVWHADKVRNFSLTALYYSKILNGLDTITAKQSVIASALDIPHTYPRRMVHYTIDGAKQQSTIYELLAYARKNEILFSYESGTNQYAECYLLITTNDRYEFFNRYFGNPNREIKGLFIRDRKSNLLKILVVAPYIYSMENYFKSVPQYASDFDCNYDYTLRLSSTDTIEIPNYSKIGAA